MINLKLTIFAILGGVRRYEGQAFFDKCLSTCNRMAASSYLPPMGIENGGLEIVVSKPPFGVRFRLERVNR